METTIRTESGYFDAFFDGMKAITDDDGSTVTIDGRAYRIWWGNYWIRDQIHMLKAYRFWEPDVRSALDFFLERQTDEGFFYEMIMPPDNCHCEMVDEPCKYYDKANDKVYIRLENEADIEYMMVEGVYHAWQACGDTEWMVRWLPALEKGIDYTLSDPKRCDPKTHLVMRTFTIDTWDFTYNEDVMNRRIEPHMPMAIMHGDNSGAYQACVLLGRMWEAASNPGKAAAWGRRASELREKTNEVCFNGAFYTHLVHLGEVPDIGRDEDKRLSLSNAYDINRFLPTHEMAVSIIREYQRRRETSGWFAEWFSINPPYPRFAHYKADEYINGCVAPFVAGELAKAAFNHGFERYGVDILRRVRDIWKEDGEKLAFLYTANREHQGGGPAGWGSAALYSAMIEGLAGIVDLTKAFEEVRLSPRWAATEETQAEVNAVYAASGARCGYVWRLTGDGISVTWDAPTAGRVEFHVLLPQGKSPTGVTCNGRQARFETSTIEEGRYVDFDVIGTSRGKAAIAM